MKTLLLLPVLGALALSAAAQTSQEQADPQQQVVPVKGNEARIDLPDHYHKMWPNDYSAYLKRIHYRMAWRSRFSAAATRYMQRSTIYGIESSPPHRTLSSPWTNS